MSTAYRGNPTAVRRVWFTGRTIHSVAGSRTVITAAPPIGAILVRDPFGHDNGSGIIGNTAPAGTGVGDTDPLVREALDYTRPQANFLHGQKVIVASVGPLSEGGIGRWVEVWNCEEAVDVLLNGTVAEQDYIIPVADQYHGAAAPATSVAELNVVLRTAIGIALQDNSGGPNRRAVKLGGPFNGSPDRI
jgi:hypothetical protein